MAVEVKKTGGPLSGKVRRTAKRGDAGAWREVMDWLRTEIVPISDLLDEHERVATEILLEAGFKLDAATGQFSVPEEADVSHPSPFWYCFEIIRRARKATLGVSREQRAFLGLALQVGRLSIELEGLKHEPRLEKAYAGDEDRRRRGKANNERAAFAAAALYAPAIAEGRRRWAAGDERNASDMARALMKDRRWAVPSFKRLKDELGPHRPRKVGSPGLRSSK